MNAKARAPLADDGALAYGEGAPLTRAGFWRRAATLRTVLDAHPAKRWALVCEDGAWFAAGLLALADPRRTVILPQAPQAGSLPTVDAVLTDRPQDFPAFSVLAAEEPPVSAPAHVHEPDDSSPIEFYTSGTGGAPKCVPKVWGQLRLEVEALQSQWGDLADEAAVAGTVPHHHLYGLLFRLLWPLYSGRAFYSRASLQPAELRAAAARGRCVLVSSPAFLTRLAGYAELPPPGQVAALFSSGAPLPEEAAERLVRDWGRAAIEVYGSTETGGIAWRSWQAGRGPWRPILGVSTEFREEDLGQRLWVRSGATWRGDWMPAGDLARPAGGGFELLGRADDVVKFEDKRVSFTEMRARLVEHGWVADARLLVLPGRRAFIGAVVVLSAEGRAALGTRGKPAVAEALRDFLRQSYEALLLPRKWRFPHDLPGNAMGKTPKETLLRLFEAEP